MTTGRPWWSGTVVYQLIVRSYSDGNGDGIGDFKGLAARLPYLRWLGVKTLWLTPIYPSPLRDGGYDITDFTGIHPDLGDLASFHRFLTAAHSQGMRVILDLVLNHTSDLHPWFQRARWAPKGSPERGVYVWSDDPKQYSDAPVLFRHFESSNWEWDSVAEQYYLHRFLRHQPDLNYANPWVQEAMLDVVDFWLERGVDGFRLDAVPFLFEAEGTRCEGLPETHAFLKRLRKRVDAHGRDVLLLGEAIQPVDEAAPYLADDELQGAFNFVLTAHLFAAIASGTAQKLGECLLEAEQAVEGPRWALPLRNHDELWLGDGHLIDDEVIQAVRFGLPQGQGHWLNWGINRRLAPLLNGDPRSNRLLHGLLYSLPGMPCLYYGDELGMGDWPGLRDRDPNRTPMAWTPARNGGFSHGPRSIASAASHYGCWLRLPRGECGGAKAVAGVIAELASADAHLPSIAASTATWRFHLAPQQSSRCFGVSAIHRRNVCFGGGECDRRGGVLEFGSIGVERTTHAGSDVGV